MEVLWKQMLIADIAIAANGSHTDGGIVTSHEQKLLTL